MRRNDLMSILNNLLQPQLFQDYCPNGLQVEGKPEIKRVLCGVSLNQALIDEAISRNTDTIIVHHGIFWNKDDYALVGIKYQRIAKLIKHDINLIAYHLPLDNHPEIGNNNLLGQLLGVEVKAQSGSQNLLWHGRLASPCSLDELTIKYFDKTGHQPRYFGKSNQRIATIAWCSGGADNMFNDAINLGVDCYLTGEVNEQIMSLSAESGVAFIAGGHYVSERLGIMALSQYLCDLNIESEFFDIYNPI